MAAALPQSTVRATLEAVAFRDVLVRFFRRLVQQMRISCAALCVAKAAISSRICCGRKLPRKPIREEIGKAWKALQKRLLGIAYKNDRRMTAWLRVSISGCSRKRRQCRLPHDGLRVRDYSKRSATPTFNAAAILKIESSVGLASPRSISLISA